jgi:hypothetical protein
MTHGTIYDPIRQKDVPDTPEERVRQATIKFLIETVKVPENLIAVEFALSTVEPSTDDRVDLLVQDFKAAGDLKHPWLLVECKAPGEYSWQALQVQLNKYLQVLTPKYVMLSLGDAVRYFVLDAATKRFQKIEKLPEFTSLQK